MATPNTAAHASVLTPSEALPADATHVKGPDFNRPITLHELLESYERIGFQATGLAKAIKIVEEMRKSRQNTEEPLTLFLGYTSNLISSGLREIIKFLCEHKMVDVLVTTAGGIEEDFIKCLGSTVLGEFAMEGAGLRKRG
ncbi:hypothetical protein QFC19_007596 [Naganishia cerealis]|uniref:Uncharacterized protein n=1 Tax=Naganishia cerealis TaxID=610337 RepID=A0ACC2V8N9_9TREE|nr:hypothetical protein QFC19_007596 [Naganishia cerealis]